MSPARTGMPVRHRKCIAHVTSVAIIPVREDH
jgi:hypothetical protein